MLCLMLQNIPLKNHNTEDKGASKKTSLNLGAWQRGRSPVEGQGRRAVRNSGFGVAGTSTTREKISE